ncbi:hypothetical protein [Maledivibacter halophilus]|uniref:Uncharacterized protein n=1 Tax=Maledivibacter halophilus TaxID=36842 RepID=A0A1T5IUC6_9FIRM|nr:hypothetical protein [Maledivibacter halophilus]SKC42779.1 hypothetical protein SAMN02194393_00755 [Maledivibacter halophilus]
MKRKIVYLLIALLLIGNTAYAENQAPANVQNPVNLEMSIRPYTINIVDNNSKIVITYQDTMEKEVIIDKNDLYYGDEDTPRITNAVFAEIKDVETSPDKSKIYFNAKRGYSDPIKYGGPYYFRYDLNTKKLILPTFMFTAPGKDYGSSEIPHKLNITSDGNIAIQRRSYSIDYNYVLYNEDFEFISLIDSIENMKTVDSVPFATVKYGKNVSDSNSASHFMLYGKEKKKNVQMKEKIKLSSNTIFNGIEMNEQPMALVADKNGTLISNPTDSHYTFRIKISNLQNEASKGGIVFGVKNDPLSEKGFNGFGLSFNPSTKHVELERFIDGQSITLKYADIPEDIDTFNDEMNIGATLSPIKNHVYLNLFIEGNRVLVNFPVAQIKDMPAWSNFGVRAFYSDVEVSDLTVIGAFTVPREK